MKSLEQLIAELCPNGVEFKKLKEVCEIKGRIGFRGYTRSDLVEESEGAITLSPSNIKNQETDFSDCSYISWFKYDESPEIQVSVGDIIFTKTASVGKTALIKQLPKEATINPQLVLLKNIKINSAYLSYYLKTDYLQKEVRKLTGVGSVPNVPQSALAELEIPVPPLAVQEKIVEILDNFTALTAELQAELQARQQQYEYYRNHLLSFGGLDNIRSEVADSQLITPPHWKLLKMSEIFEIRNGYTPSKNNADFWDGGTIPWFRMEDIRANGRILSDSFQHITPKAVKGKGLFEKDSFIIATTATIGEHAWLIADSLANQRFTNLKVHKSLTASLMPKFVYYYLFIVDEWCKRNVNASSFASVDMDKFKDLEFPIPPLAEQQRIVDILDRFEALTSDLQNGLPAEIAARQQQYEYYRNKLLTFKRKTA